MHFLHEDKEATRLIEFAISAGEATMIAPGARVVVDVVLCVEV